MRAKRLLVFSDSPTVATGFGTVVKNTVLSLRDHFDGIVYWGINYHGVPHELPAVIWPAHLPNDPDPYGRARFLTHCWQNEMPSVLFLLQDHFTLAETIQFPDGSRRSFAPGLIDYYRKRSRETGDAQPRVIAYIPVDGEMLRPSWVDWMPGRIDYPVAYCQWGRRVLLDTCPYPEAGWSRDVAVIPHGVDTSLFRPLDKSVRRQWRQKLFGIDDDTPLIVSVARNQPRKDVVATLDVFNRVRKIYPDARLYLHMDPADPANSGLALEAVRLSMRIPKGCVAYPANFSVGSGIPEDRLAVVYGLGDVFVSTALGEGWGLPLIESMAAGTPVVAPDHTSHREILAGGDAGVLVPCCGVGYMRNDHEQPRPVTDVRLMADAICRLLHNRDELAAMGVRARARVVANWDWVDVRKQWADVFHAATQEGQRCTG